ncbi:hypothetical protein MRX96_048223 [Rhipicephalus microplus]
MLQPSFVRGARAPPPGPVTSFSYFCASSRERKAKRALPPPQPLYIPPLVPQSTGVRCWRPHPSQLPDTVYVANCTLLFRFSKFISSLSVSVFFAPYDEVSLPIRCYICAFLSLSSTGLERSKVCWCLRYRSGNTFKQRESACRGTRVKFRGVIRRFGCNETVLAVARTARLHPPRLFSGLSSAPPCPISGGSALVYALWRLWPNTDVKLGGAPGLLV